MAPRGRSRKSLAGSKRIDAAIQHAAPLGFSQATVRSTVRKLLEAYEGEQGWYFIEENSYKLLFETILDDQKEEQSEKVSEVVAPDSGSRTRDDWETEASEAAGLQTSQATEQDGAAEERVSQVFETAEAGRSSGSEQSQLNQASAPRRRQPLQGWLSEDEDEFNEEDLRGSIKIQH